MFWQRPIRFSELVSRVYPKGVNPSLLQYFGDRRLNQISGLMIEDYKASRLLSVSPASVNREIAVIKHCFCQAVLWSLTDKNPAKDVKMFKETSRSRVISYTEEEQILTSSPIWLREIVLVALNTGMRSGEILSLLWSDVDFNAKTIIISHTKNNQPRTIPLNDTLYNLLQQKSQSPYEKVFPNVRVEKVSKVFNQVCQETGIENLRFHDIRHTFCSRLSMSGCNTLMLMDLLGHRTTSITRKYSHNSMDSLRTAVSHLENTTLNQ